MAAKIGIPNATPEDALRHIEASKGNSGHDKDVAVQLYKLYTQVTFGRLKKWKTREFGFHSWILFSVVRFTFTNNFCFVCFDFKQILIKTHEF